MAFNMDPKKCPMPTQDPNVRNKNFEEVALGYTEEMAVNEAKRCIHCKNKPCQTGCPVGIDIPEFIGHVAEGDFEAAYQVIARSSSLPAVCGRVCPQESQCEGKCTRGIKNEPVGIGRLERFVADWHRENVHTAPIVPAWNGHRVAIIGAGPIGLVAGMVAQAYGAHAILLDLVQERLDFAKSLGIEYVINSGKEDPVERIKEITGGEMAHQVMECSGANPAIRQTFDLVSNAGRITLTGWPKKETSLPTDVITKKEIDIRGARTSAGEFEEALDLINSRKVDMMKILTKTVTMDEAPDTIVDIEKNPGNYMKVVVRVSNDD